MSGWRIVEINAQDGKIYITKIIHAGTPKKFVFYHEKAPSNTYSVNRYCGYKAEYVLSSGTRGTGYPYYYNGIKQSRNWDMYIDKNQLDLIKEVHCITKEEVTAITGGNGTKNSVLALNRNYWLANGYFQSGASSWAKVSYGLYCVKSIEDTYSPGLISTISFTGDWGLDCTSRHSPSSNPSRWSIHKIRNRNNR